MPSRTDRRRRAQRDKPERSEGDAGSSHHLHPKFSLEHLVDAYCLSKCSRGEKAQFADRLHELSQLTWQQIGQAPRHGQGYETLPRQAIRTGLPTCITEDLKLLAFRCIGKAPMVGFKVHDTFYVVWIDRDFSLYPH